MHPQVRGDSCRSLAPVLQGVLGEPFSEIRARGVRGLHSSFPAAGTPGDVARGPIVATGIPSGRARAAVRAVEGARMRSADARIGKEIRRRPGYCGRAIVLPPSPLHHGYTR
jgi:hypothetical protein